jgi:hypothetical protein
VTATSTSSLVWKVLLLGVCVSFVSFFVGLVVPSHCDRGDSLLLQALCSTSAFTRKKQHTVCFPLCLLCSSSRDGAVPTATVVVSRFFFFAVVAKRLA